MQRMITFITLLAGCIALSACTSLNTGNKKLQKPDTPPAYLIISINEIRPEMLGPFKKAVRPIVQEKAGGAELLAFSKQKDIQLLEGKWENQGILLIERFKSMEALKAYWYSDEYTEVKKLREGHAEANFFIAVEGRPLSLLESGK